MENKETNPNVTHILGGIRDAIWEGKDERRWLTYLDAGYLPFDSGDFGTDAPLILAANSSAKLFGS